MGKHQSVNKYYLGRRQRAIEYLGGKCIECESTELLEFDHIDPTKKSYDPSTNMHCAFETLTKELDKCQLLCSICHGKKTALFISYRDGFDDETLEDIRGMLELGIKQKDIASMYGVSQATISNIKVGNTYTLRKG